MGYIDAFCKGDVAAVANLHNRIRFGSSGPASPGLMRYYEEMFLENPWLQKDMPSLVYRDEDGTIKGFMGRICRFMVFKGSSLRVAIAHRIMASEENPYSLTAIKLTKEFLAGPQDLSLSDGANKKAKAIWTRCDGSVSYLYSINWFCPLRPIGFISSQIFKKKSTYLIPFIKPFDVLCAATKKYPYRVNNTNCESIPVGKGEMLQYMRTFDRSFDLFSEYDEASLNWQIGVLEKNKHRGCFHKYKIVNTQKRVVGLFLYYIHASGIIEVLYANSYAQTSGQVFDHILYHAWKMKAVGIIGRMEPFFMESMWNRNLMLKKGSWTLIHSKNQELVSTINAGRSFISMLDGELWLRSPFDKL